MAINILGSPRHLPLASPDQPSCTRNWSLDESHVRTTGRNIVRSWIPHPGPGGQVLRQPQPLILVKVQVTVGDDNKCFVNLWGPGKSVFEGEHEKIVAGTW